MHRDKLIRQVKDEYAIVACRQNRENFADESSAALSDAYYRHLFEQVITAIQAGRFDRFINGRQIMEAVASDRQRWGILS